MKEFDRAKMLEELDQAIETPLPPLPYEVTTKEMATRWGVTDQTAIRRMRKLGFSERRCVVSGRQATAWWLDKWKELYESRQASGRVGG